jgi:magnesium transporter
MIATYAKTGARIAKADNAVEALFGDCAVWIDLFDPTAEEEELVESYLKIDVPLAHERAAFEDSARFYEENGALYVTVTLLGRREDGAFQEDAVTFVLVNTRLVTVRKIRPRAFELGEGRASARIAEAADGNGVFVALLDGCIERLADVLQEATTEAHAIARSVFDDTRSEPNLKDTLRKLGRSGTIASLAHDSLASLERATAYIASVCPAHGLDAARMHALRRDIEQLERNAEALQTQLSFVQEATLGLVSAAQNNSLKALSVATIAFVPPTLIASIFGMNFEAMTWFQKGWGPLVGFALMIAAPVALFTLAKWRRWF